MGQQDEAQDNNTTEVESIFPKIQYMINNQPIESLPPILPLTSCVALFCGINFLINAINDLSQPKHKKAWVKPTLLTKPTEQQQQQQQRKQQQQQQHEQRMKESGEESFSELLMKKEDYERLMKSINGAESQRFPLVAKFLGERLIKLIVNTINQADWPD